MNINQRKGLMNQLPTKTHITRAQFAAIALAILTALGSSLFGDHQPVRAEVTDTCGLQIELIAAPFAVTDSNKPGEEGPRVGTMGARITNTSGVALDNVSIHLGDGTTPGAFTASSGGSLALLDALDASHLMTQLDAGARSTSYWPVTYPATFDVGYPYTVWATTPSGCSVSASSQITTQSEISATANKLQPTGGLILVSPDPVAPGGLISVQVIGFTLGTIGQGPRPLAPYDAWLQPIGNLDFDPTCLRLVKSEVYLSSVSSTPFVDRLYFSGLTGYRNGSSDYVDYTFLALKECATIVQPYQEAASGTQEKYNADYDVNRISVVSSGQTDLFLDLTSDKSTVSANETIQLSADINSAGSQVGYPDNGSPVVITAEIAPETTYLIGSSSSTVPSSFQYSTDGGLTWQDGEPTDPNTVTHIRWLLQESVDSTVDTVSYSVTTDSTYSGSSLNITAEAGLLNSAPLTDDTVYLNGVAPTPEPTPTPTATPPPEVQSGGEGGLESGPLPGEPSAFIGGIGDEDEATAAAVEQVQSVHKARLLEEMSIKIDDLMPTSGPAGTTPNPAIPVDVLAFTTVPDAEAVDFVDANGKVRAVALGIQSIDRPYEHDYGVCNRFKEYTIDDIAPVGIDLNLPGNKGTFWFWQTHASKGDSIREDAFIFHIFVDESSKTFHIDSRWIQDAYPTTFDYAFDYVFNMQVWSGNRENSSELLKSILSKLTQLENGSWQLAFHNNTAAATPQVFIAATEYQADTVKLEVENRSDTRQSVQIEGVWRDQINRDASYPFQYNLALPAGRTTLALAFPGLRDVTLLLVHDGFRDKIYNGGGLWFDFSNSEQAVTNMTLGSCRTLDNVDIQDLSLAGCVDLTASELSRIDEIGLGRTLNPNGRPVDVSPYRALRFWAKGDGSPIRVFLETAGVTDGDHHQAIVTPDGEWRQYIIPLNEFAQRDFGAPGPFTGTDVKSVIWGNAEISQGTLNLSIDQVSFTNEGLIEQLQKPSDSPATDGRLLTVVPAAGTDVSEMTAFYSLDDGATFQSMVMTPGDNQFTTQLPGQDLGTDVYYYVEARQRNGYVSLSPLDAPASYYRYRVDDRGGLLVDDFAELQLSNRLKGKAGIFNEPTVGGRLRAYRYARQLILDYDVSQEGQLAGYFSRLQNLDAGAFTTLNIMLRGEKGGENMLLGLRDSNGVESKVSVGDLLVGGITTEWQWLQVPLSAFPGDLNRRDLENLNFTFQSDYAPRQGRVYIKEMRFTTLNTPVVVDTFDDGNANMNAQGLGYWSAAPESSLSANLVKDDSLTATGSALRLDYTVGSSGYALWQSPLNTVAIGQDARLSLWVKDAKQTIMPNIYLVDRQNRARVSLADYVTPGSNWQLVQIPVSAFADQGVNMQELTSIQIVFEYASGSGQFWVDNIALGSPGVPQVERRVLYLNDVDSRALAAHLPDGASWSSSSNQRWLSLLGASAGPASLTVESKNWGLGAGTHTGQITLFNQAGTGDTITVHVAISQPGPDLNELFLPLMTR